MATNKAKKPTQPKYTKEQALERLAKVKLEAAEKLKEARDTVNFVKTYEARIEKARLAEIAAIERKAENHRKIIFGVVALHGMATDSELKRVMQKYAKEHLTVPEDLALFEL
jgi:DUF1680 family protein